MNASMAGSPLAPSTASCGATLSSGALPARSYRREAQAAQEPVEIVDPVAHPGRVRVAQQVVAAIDVERAADRMGQVRQRVLAAHQRRHPRRHAAVERRQHLVHAGRRIEEDLLGPLLVVRRPGDGVLEEVRERTVTEVVEQGRGERVLGAVAGHPLPEGELVLDGPQAREEQLHHVRRAERVGEASVLRAGEGHVGDAELTHAAQALHLGRVEQLLDDALLLRLEGDEAVDRVAQRS